MTRSRNSHELIWGALIGALFLWGSLSWHLGVTPSVAWILPQWPMFFALCVASPILEEYVFRSLIYDVVDTRWSKVWPIGGYISISLANALTTCLFVTTTCDCARTYGRRFSASTIDLFRVVAAALWWCRHLYGDSCCLECWLV